MKKLYRKALIYLLAVAMVAPAWLVNGMFSATRVKAAVDGSNVVISQVAVGINTASNEFVEFYNPTSTAIVLSDANFKILTVDSNNVSSPRALTWINHTIPPKGYFLIASGNVGVVADATYSSAKLTGRSGIIIEGSLNNIIDKVGWGETDQPSLAVETMGVNIGLVTDVSIERKTDLSGIGNGLDTDNNANDFILLNTPDPRNSSFVIDTIAPTMVGLTATVDGVDIISTDGTLTVTQNSITSSIIVEMSEPVVLRSAPIVMININGADYAYGSIALDPLDAENKTLIIKPFGSNGVAGMIGTFVFTVDPDSVEDLARNANVKTNFTLTVVDLMEAKIKAHTDLNEARTLYNDGDYSSENLAILNQFKTEGDIAIDDATTLHELTLALQTATAGMAGIETISIPTVTISINGKIVTLSWNKVPKATGYKVYVGKSSDNWIINGLQTTDLTYLQTFGDFGSFVVRVTAMFGTDEGGFLGGINQKNIDLVSSITPIAPVAPVVITEEVATEDPVSTGLVATVQAAPPAEQKVETPSDDNGQIKSEETSSETEDINWTPWIVLFVLILLAGAATGGYFYWFAGSEEDNKPIVKEEKKIEKKAIKKSASKDPNRKSKRW